MSVLTITSANFENEVLNSDKIVLVDFWAAWCNPCKMMAPILEEVANEVGESYKICKLNIDEEPQLASQYRIMTIPTLAVFKNKELVKKLVGVHQKNDVIELLKNS